MNPLRIWYRATLEAYYRFNTDDGWATASHIALSTLMALFPFFILVTALAGFIGNRELADQAADLLFEAWPEEVAGPIAREIHNVLTVARGDVLTLGVLFAIFFASSGIESLRIGLNRAYGVIEQRHWALLRIESIAYVMVGAIAMIVLGFLIVLAPLILATATRQAKWLAQFEETLTFWRFGVASVVLVVSLILVHKWLPAGRRRFAEIMPGIIMTLVLWLVAGMLFGRYLAEFAYTYVTYYAGLASVMIALVFLYYTSSIFLFGGEFNAAVQRGLAHRKEAVTAAAEPTE